MLWDFDALKGFRLHTSDGDQGSDLGHVHDLLFTDQGWHVRWLVVDTGWIFGRRVLIAPSALGEPEGQARRIPVALTRQQVKDSPSIDTDKPVNRQQEDLIYRYYGWAPYWSAGGATGLPFGPTTGLGAGGLAGGTSDFTGPPPGHQASRPGDTGGTGGVGQGDTGGDPHLRSAREVTGYTVTGRDGARNRDVGTVTGLILDTGDPVAGDPNPGDPARGGGPAAGHSDSGWTIRWIVVDTGAFLASHPVIISPDWVREVDWPESRLFVTVTAERVKGAPAYDPATLLSRAAESQTYDWHGMPPYW